MKIALGNDHAGVSMRPALLDELKKRGHEIIDLGTNSTERGDYPDFAKKVGELVAQGKADRGVLVCGTGVGIAMAANKVKGARAAVVTDDYTARMSRERNDTNIIAFRGREFDPEENRRLLGIWLDTPFSEGERHKMRLEKLKRMDAER